MRWARWQQAVPNLMGVMAEAPPRRCVRLSVDDGVLAPVERGDVLTLSAESVESESVTPG